MKNTTKVYTKGAHFFLLGGNSARFHATYSTGDRSMTKSKVSSNPTSEPDKKKALEESDTLAYESTSRVGLNAKKESTTLVDAVSADNVSLPDAV